MNPALPFRAHLAPGELLGLLDGDAAADELTRGGRHLEECERCRGALARLERRSRRLSGMLHEIELPADFVYPAEPAPRAAARSIPGASGTATWWLRAAAVILLLLIPLLTVSPLRAAVTGWLSARWSDVTDLAWTAGSDSVESSEAAVQAAGSALSFVPAGAELRIEFALRQRSGSLAVRRVAGAEMASLQVTEGNGAEDITVSEYGVRIRNSPDATASITLDVPAGVRRVVVQIAAEPALKLGSEAMVGGREIALGNSP